MMKTTNRTNPTPPTRNRTKLAGLNPPIPKNRLKNRVPLEKNFSLCDTQALGSVDVLLDRSRAVSGSQLQFHRGLWLATLTLLWVLPAQSPADEAAPSADNHWAFQPIRRPELPAVSNPDWVRNPIDAFVLARLDGESIAPSPEADRTTLIRRLNLDLLGLLPSPEEVDAFLNDDRPGADERLVDRLLASPHFGERWGRHWLDLARYADSDGYEKDNPRPYAYLYRDWVIQAINDDMPYDLFSRQQLAGDLLENPSLEQKVATGFHRNTLTNTEGGVDQEEFRVRANVDRVATTSTVWLGLTMQCAECHSHKYDPISQREFYEMFAFFNSVKEVDLPAPHPRDVAAYNLAKKNWDDRQRQLNDEISAYEKSHLPGKLAAWEKTVDIPNAVWTPLEPIGLRSKNGATLTADKDRSITVTGLSPETDAYTFVTRTDLQNITGLRLEALTDKSLPAEGPGRTGHGNFVLNEFTVRALADQGSDEAIPVNLQNATTDFSQGDFAVEGAIDGNPKTGWAIGDQKGKTHQAVFETISPTGFTGGTWLEIRLRQEHGGQHTIGKFRISATNAEKPIQYDPLPDDVARILRIAPDQRTEEHIAELTKYYRPLDADWVEIKNQLAEHEKAKPNYPPEKAPTLAVNDEPRQTFIHVRGDFLRKGDEVQHQTPAVLHPFKPRNGQPDRIDLADWLMDPSNPLTARVTANRMWQYLFGQGIVRSTEDFGVRGEPPTHPELLDWLATELVRRNWGRKDMIRLIVGSAAYRQSSKTRKDLHQRDPTNKLLASQNRYRLDSEIVRDLNLDVSGLLVPTIGGPSVRPPLPSGVAELGYAGSIKWNPSQGQDKYRRGAYIFFQRTVPYPMLTTFDSPDSNTTCTRRERSNTPLQALTLLNDPVFYECAQGLGRHVVAECDGPAQERARQAFRQCVSREPTPAETAQLTSLYEEQLALCKADPEAAKAILGDPPIGEDLDPAESAAWIAVTRILLNLDEFITRE
jgi:hypothetical protein